MLRLPCLDGDPAAAFPPAERALREPDGLLAYGGDLSPTRLLNAYAQGIFPWYSAGQPILWWSPDPRMVLSPQALRISRSLRRHLRRCDWLVSINQRFADVIDACASLPRNSQGGTWITAEMQAAYIELHRLGYAHSLEVQRKGQLLGGIYGIALGKMFFGESMFSTVDNGSKVAIAALCRALQLSGTVLLDGQVESEHLASLGFGTLPRRDFLQLCQTHASNREPWQPEHIDLSALQPAALASTPESRAATGSL